MTGKTIIFTEGKLSETRLSLSQGGEVSVRAAPGDNVMTMLVPCYSDQLTLSITLTTGH